MAIGAAQEPPDESVPEIALRLVDEHGIVATQLPLKIVGRNRGLHGGDIALTDHGGTVEVAIRLDAQTRQLTLNCHFAVHEKVLPGAMLPALRFLSGIHAGLSVIVLINGQAAGPPIGAPQTLPAELPGYTRLATDLEEIQRKSGVYFPMPSSLSGDEQDNILIAK